MDINDKVVGEIAFPKRGDLNDLHVRSSLPNVTKTDHDLAHIVEQDLQRQIRTQYNVQVTLNGWSADIK